MPKHAPDLEMTGQDSWRIFRIMAEFVEGFESLANIGPAVSNAEAAALADVRGVALDGLSPAERAELPDWVYDKLIEQGRKDEIPEEMWK